jgi:hypothetical protein
MHIEKSNSIKELATALAMAQSQVGVAIKDKKNPFFKSNYADLGSVWDACKDALQTHGLSVVQMPVDSDVGRVALATWLLHESGEYMMSVVSAPTVLTAKDGTQTDNAQTLGSALTYLRRYALASFVGIVADDDDDGNAASQQQPQKAQQHANGKQENPTQLREKLRIARSNAGVRGAIVKSLTQAQVVAMTVQELQAEIAATEALYAAEQSA